MTFAAEAAGNSIHLDAKSPIGKGSAMTPKELVAVGLAGCMAMDVVAMMRKYKQNMDSFNVETNIETTSSGHPVVFTKAINTIQVQGNVEREKLIDAVEQSQTKYCGVSAMLSKSFPIEYVIMLNGETIAEGKASFQ